MRVVVTHTGADVPFYKPEDVHRIATVLVRLSDLAVEDDQRAEAQDWADSFLKRAAPNTMDVGSFTDPAGKWEALSIMRDWRPPAGPQPGSPPAEAAVIVRDATGRRLVRAADLAAHVRAERGQPISWGSLQGRMTEIGWEYRGQIQQRQPGGEGKLKARVYAIPAGWEDK